jgi:hypothetical protein
MADIPKGPGQSTGGAARPSRRESSGESRRPPDAARAHGGAPPKGKTPAPRRRRRWKSSEEAYEAGVRAGLLCAIDLVAIINDPGIITELGEAFAANLRAGVGLDPKPPDPDAFGENQRHIDP